MINYNNDSDHRKERFRQQLQNKHGTNVTRNNDEQLVLDGSEDSVLKLVLMSTKKIIRRKRKNPNKYKNKNTKSKKQWSGIFH